MFPFHTRASAVLVRCSVSEFEPGGLEARLQHNFSILHDGQRQVGEVDVGDRCRPVIVGTTAFLCAGTFGGNGRHAEVHGSILDGTGRNVRDAADAYIASVSGSEIARGIQASRRGCSCAGQRQREIAVAQTRPLAAYRSGNTVVADSPNRQVCGRMWDWSLEPTAALYFTQNAHQPLHAQFDFIKNTVTVNNEFPRDFTGQVTARVLDFNMREVLRKNAPVRVASEAVTNNILSIAFPADVTPVHFIKLELADAKGRPVSDTFYWRSKNDYKPGRTWTGPQFDGFEDLSKLPRVQLASEVTWNRAEEKNTARVAVRNPSGALAFQVWLRLQHADTAKPVRPAFYDDNFFSLLPGETRVVRIEFDATAAAAEKVQLVVDGWNVEAQTYRPRPEKTALNAR
jgi:hypothetical protein